MPQPKLVVNEDNNVEVHMNGMSAEFILRGEAQTGFYEIWFTEKHGERHNYASWFYTDAYSAPAINETLNYRFCTKGIEYAHLVLNFSLLQYNK